MSQENVGLVRRLIEHWEQGDWRWGRDVFDDECEAVFSASWFPEAGNYRGGAEALHAWMPRSFLNDMRLRHFRSAKGRFPYPQSARARLIHDRSTTRRNV